MNIPLKVTTDYSLLKSLIKVKDLMDFLVARKVPACGICDDNLSGVLEFYFACKNNGIKPIIGLNVKVSGKSVYLYAKNYAGYKELIEINSKDINDLDNIKSLKNVIVILPFDAWGFYHELKDFSSIYLGYSNTGELEKLKNVANKIFINDIRCLQKDDVKYLDYLSMLRKESKEDYGFVYYDDKALDLGVQEELISMIDIEIIKENDIPVFTTDSKTFLKNLAYKGLYKRLNGHMDKRYLERLEYELSVIEKMGYIDYFLIVYDYVLYAKKNNILVGPGRGSAAGALLSYAIGITEIDPLKYDLLFERFLNPERITMPDIDIDFEDTKREKVIEYVRNKYGKDNVALGLTFSTFKSKLLLRELGKVLKINPDLIDMFLKNIDANLSLRENLEKDSVKKYLENYEVLKNLYNISFHLEGLKRNTSIHAAGVVISKYKLKELIPINITNTELITGVPLDNLESLGILKMDFLALRNLTIIHKILNLIGNINLNSIDLNDDKVLSIFRVGATEGIFQFETPLLKNLAVRLEPTSFSDLVALLALGRPGPLIFADTFIKRKKGQEKPIYLDRKLESILKSTYGIILYQEQIMSILKIIGGYTYAEADLIRRAISKKKESIILKHKEEFVSRAIHNGYTNETAIKIYADITRFASYGFNKSHSVSYAYLAYQMAYLKCYYPKEFIIVMLNENITQESYNYYLNYLKENKIKILKPDINYSAEEFRIKDNYLIMPLWKIKNITKDIASKIVLARNTRFLDYYDFVLKTKDFINPTILKYLIEAGALDSLKINKHTLMENMENVFNYVALEDGSGLIKKPLFIEYPEYDAVTLRNYELASFGFFVSNHPTTMYYNKSYIKLSDIKNNVFKKIKVLAYIENIKSIKTKKNEDMAFIKGSDDTGIFDFNVFPNKFALLKDIKELDVVEIYGEVSKYYDKISFSVLNIKKVG